MELLSTQEAAEAANTDVNGLNYVRRLHPEIKPVKKIGKILFWSIATVDRVIEIRSRMRQFAPRQQTNAV